MRRWAAAVVAAGVLVGCAAGAEDTAEDREHAAFDVCTQFVERRLKAPDTAKFRNYFQDDGEVIVTGGPTTFVVISSVDSENSFGASLRTEFTCTVQTEDGKNFTLVDLTTS